MAAISILKAIALLAEREPNRPVLIEGERVVTRAAFDADTNRLARAFQAAGVERDDYVSLILPNGVEFLQSVAAIWKLGAIPQPLPPKLAAKELNEIIALAKPKLIVGNPPNRPVGCGVIPAGFTPDHTISADPLPDAVAPHFKAMVSGGSTGRPKVIVAGNPGMIDLDAPFPTVRPNETFLVTGPLYHNAPFLAATTCMLSGGCAVIMSHFDAELTLQMIERHRVNFMSLVPTMMHRMWRLGARVRNKYDLSSIRAMIHSASSCPVWLKEAWIEWLGPDRVLEAYSNTEAPGYTVITGREWLRKKGSVGKADSKTCEIKIADRNGKELPRGQVGEVYMRPVLGPDSTYCYGDRYFYIGAAPRQIQGGWDSMGDLGYLDEDGYLFLADRRVDLIIRGGANIYPAEVEAAIDAHPAVRSSAVFGLPDEDLGEKVVAIVDSEFAISQDELVRHLKQHLTPYKIPEVFEFTNAPLRNDCGKVRRSDLRAARLNPAPMVTSHAA